MIFYYLKKTTPKSHFEEKPKDIGFDLHDFYDFHGVEISDSNGQNRCVLAKNIFNIQKIFCPSNDLIIENSIALKLMNKFPELNLYPVDFMLPYYFDKSIGNTNYVEEDPELEVKKLAENFKTTFEVKYKILDPIHNNKVLNAYYDISFMNLKVVDGFDSRDIQVALSLKGLKNHGAIQSFGIYLTEEFFNLINPFLNDVYFSWTKFEFDKTERIAPFNWKNQFSENINAKPRGRERY